jgi:hypothetical protein
MSIDVVVTPAIILAVAVLAIFAMIVYYWIRTTYGQCTSDTTENQSMLILELSRLIYTKIHILSYIQLRKLFGFLIFRF